MRTQNYLMNLLETMEKSGSPDRDFFYLGGPMTGFPKHNFLRFEEIAETLRCNGYNIISPAEIDSTDTRSAIMNGEYDEAIYPDEYFKWLERDFIICSLPTCVGGIFFDHWQNSRGAANEYWLLTALEKERLLFTQEGNPLNLPNLTVIDSITRPPAAYSNAGPIEIQEGTPCLI